jgi:hypothetical protein
LAGKRRTSDGDNRENPDPRTKKKKTEKNRVYKNTVTIGQTKKGKKKEHKTEVSNNSLKLHNTDGRIP